MARRELVTLSLYTLLASNRTGLLLVLLPIYLVEFKGASVSAALVILSLGYVAGSLIGPLAGRWSDLVGRRKSFLVAGEATALPLYLLIPLASGVAAAGALFIAGTVALSFGAPSLNAYVGDVTRENQRGSGYGLLNATAFAGSVVGFLVVGLAIARFGFDALFVFIAVTMVATLSILVAFVPELKLPPSAARNPWREYKPLLTFSVAVSIRSLGMGAIGAFFGVYAYLLGANALEVSALAITGSIVAAVVSLPFGRYIDTAGEIRGIWYGTVLTLIGILVFALATTWLELLPAQMLRYAGICLLGPGMLAWVARISPEGHRAEYLGIFSLINSTLWSLGPLAGGLAYQVSGSLGLYVFSIGTTVASLLALEYLYFARLRRSTTVAPPPVVGVPGRAPPAAK